MFPPFILLLLGENARGWARSESKMLFNIVEKLYLNKGMTSVQPRWASKQTEKKMKWNYTKTVGYSPTCAFVRAPFCLKTPRRLERRLQSAPKQNDEDDGESPPPTLIEKVTGKVEIGIQNVLAVVLLGALGLSCANVLAKVGVVTFALVSVSVRYTIVGILLVVLVVYVL